MARGRLLEALYVSTANSLTVIQTLEELDPEHRVALATTDLFAELVTFQIGRGSDFLFDCPANAELHYACTFTTCFIDADVYFQILSRVR